MIVLIALLAVLGVDVIVIVVFLGGVLGRRRWLSRQAGAFSGIAHVVDGEIHELDTRPRRGYGRWVRDVLVWTSTPLCLRNALAPIDWVEGTRDAEGKVRRLGDNPRVVTFAAGGSRTEVTAGVEDLAWSPHPFADAAPTATDPTS
jgi:hypothetical protein